MCMLEAQFAVYGVLAVACVVACFVVCVVELFISNKNYCWRGKAGVMATGPKSVTSRVGNAHFPFFTQKIFIPVQVKRGALKVRSWLLWVSPAWRALFSCIFSPVFIFFHQML